MDDLNDSREVVVLMLTGNSTHVNISVIVGDDNKAVLYVALDRNDMPFYACDAGCLDPPIKLGSVGFFVLFCM